MPLRKVADGPPPPCLHPEHNPPSMILLDPGTYEHTCPGCGRKVVFAIPPRPIAVSNPLANATAHAWPGSTVIRST